MSLFIQTIGSVVGIVAFLIIPSPQFFIMGGLICLAMDIKGFLAKKLNPLVPLVLYFLGLGIMKNLWLGILLGSIIGNALEVFLMLLFVETAIPKSIRKFFGRR